MNGRVRILLFLCCLALAFSACARKQEEKERIASVNDAPIFLKDFQKDVSIISRRDQTFRITPQAIEDLLQTGIDRKLMIQEAVKRGLAEDERFVESIKTFWEQTLIRELIDAKTKELGNRFFVTDDEIKRHYERMRWKLMFRVASRAAETEALEAKERMKRGERVTGEEVIGPLLMEDVRLANPLYNAFALSAGDAGVWKTRGRYFVVVVAKKETAGVPELNEVYVKIRDSLLEQKREKAFDIWLDTLRESAKIDINREVLGRVANE